MSTPSLTPVSITSKVVLTSTGSAGDVTTTNLPFGMYADSTAPLYSADFVSGAVDQVAYTYRKLGGDILDIELTTQNIYASYEESVLEYSYHVNLHQAKNVLPSVLGDTTGTFDHDGVIKSGALSSSLSGEQVSLKYPKFDYGYIKPFSDKMSSLANIGGTKTVYSASFATEEDQQDYDLQSIVSSSAASAGNPFSGKVANKKISVQKIYYKTTRASWRFYGYYGGLGTVGNMNTYGQFADDSTWQIVPVWQNKAQAAAYEDAINTRTSHFSYSIKNNKLRVYPIPKSFGFDKMWIEFTVEEDAWVEDGSKTGVDGINNINTVPFSNIPFNNINSMGKQWIRRFALALTKEMLGQVRGKFGVIPIPGESVTLNASDLLSQSKEEQEKLKEELKQILEDTTYDKLIERNSTMAENTAKALAQIPYGIYMG